MNKNNVPIKSSIGFKLLRAVFGLYVIIAIIVTSGHVAVEYRRAKDEVKEAFALNNKVLGQTLTHEVWHLDLKALDHTLSGIIQMPYVVGVSVHSSEGSILARTGIVSVQEKDHALYRQSKIEQEIDEVSFSNDLFWHSFELVDTEHSVSEPIGLVYMYSSPSVIAVKVQNVFIPIIGFAAIKVFALGVIFLYFGRRILSEPLDKMVSFIRKFPLMTITKDEHYQKDENELEILESALLLMSVRLKETLIELRTHRDHLKDMVRERTKELEISNRYLEEAVKELETFSYSISHDLKAPLRAISGYSGMLHEDYSDILDEEGNKLVNVIIDNAVQMNKLIEDILQYSRMVRMPLKMGNVHIKKLTEGVIVELEGECKDRDIEINVQEMPNCNGDSIMIKQVLVNLLSNAIKYTGKKEKAEIEVGSKQIDNETVYYVKDNGVGFDMKYSDKLFGLFERLHSTKEFEGTGVGLAIAHRLIYKHRGKIWADAKINEGATFYFSL
jgi:signal transduction histidine kinase